MSVLFYSLSLSLSLFRYRSKSFITIRERAIEKTPIIYDKTKNKNERYIRCEMRQTTFEKIQIDKFCAGTEFLETKN